MDRLGQTQTHPLGAGSSKDTQGPPLPVPVPAQGPPGAGTISRLPGGDDSAPAASPCPVPDLPSALHQQTRLNSSLLCRECPGRPWQGSGSIVRHTQPHLSGWTGQPLVP